MKRVLSSRQRKTKDVGILLDEALDEECQGREFEKYEGKERNSAIYKQ